MALLIEDEKMYSNF